ncbi:Inner membrane protein YgaZ [Andreprevotia sp. IGB-42]|nr:Inner membrane protein YgaZ [Andreprevotia sp. IGB-42]
MHSDGAWVTAFKRSSPFLLSAFLSGIVFGALAENAGLSVGNSLLMSAWVYSGAAQFVGLQLLVAHADLAVVLLTTLLLSLRFFIYAMSLVEEVKAVPITYRALLAFGLIDQVFFLAKDRYKEPVSAHSKHLFFLACVLIFYCNWLAGTAVGIYVGDRMASHVAHLGFDFIATASFIAMLGPYLKKRRFLQVSLASFLLYLPCQNLPYNLGLIVACLGAVALVKAFDFRRKRTLSEASA